MSPLKSHRVAARRLLQALLLPVVWGCGPGAFAADSADADRAAPWRNDAHAHEQGEAQARDVVRAVALYCQSARQGEVAAQSIVKVGSPFHFTMPANSGWRVVVDNYNGPDTDWILISFN